MDIYSICILDDQIPVNAFKEFMDDKRILNQNNFQHLLGVETNWEDKNLLAFVKNIYADATFNLSGFTSHSFFLKYCKEDIYTPHIIIFDWDIAGQLPDDSKKYLLEILENIYCLVAIFTQADTNDEISAMLKNAEFKPYEERLFIIKKEESESIKKLTETINEKKKLFSFEMGHELRCNTLSSLNSVLSSIGKLSYNQFISEFGENENGRKVLKKIDFIDFVIDKLKTYLVSKDLENFPLSVNRIEPADINEIKKIWHFRLYHSPDDNLVRKGDIIKNQYEDKYYLVLTSDCHLDGFWRKNLGYLTLVPLYSTNNLKFKKRLKQSQKAGSLTNYTISSLTNSYIKSFTILPSLIKNHDGSYQDYFLVSKEIQSVRVRRNKARSPDSQLKYEDIPSFIGTGRKRLSEPFISPLTQQIMEQVAGYGVPDFSTILKDALKKNVSLLSL